MIVFISTFILVGILVSVILFKHVEEDNAVSADSVSSREGARGKYRVTNIENLERVYKKLVEKGYQVNLEDIKQYIEKDPTNIDKVCKKMAEHDIYAGTKEDFVEFIGYKASVEGKYRVTNVENIQKLHKNLVDNHGLTDSYEVFRKFINGGEENIQKLHKYLVDNHEFVDSYEVFSAWLGFKRFNEENLKKAYAFAKENGYRYDIEGFMNFLSKEENLVKMYNLAKKNGYRYDIEGFKRFIFM